MWTFLIFIIGAISIYLLWLKIKALQKDLQDALRAHIKASKEVTKLHIDPKNDEFLDLPLIREVVGLKHGELDKADREKLIKWGRENWKTFSLNLTFFPDKELFFSDYNNRAGFFNFPNTTTTILSENLAYTDEGCSIEYNVAIRWLEIPDLFSKQKVPVYVGYLKKSKSIIHDKNDEVITLFQVPHWFLVPDFFRDSKIMAKLEKYFGLGQTENGSDVDFTNDFGEQDWYSSGISLENKYFSIRY